MSNWRDKPDPRARVVLSDFLRGRPLWLIIGVAGALLAGVIVVVVVIPLFRSVSPESHQQEARQACRAEVEQQLEAASIRFVDETADEFGQNTWNVQGSAKLGGSERRDYTCTYSGGELVEVNVG